MESHVSASSLVSAVFVIFYILAQSAFGVDSVNQFERFSLLTCNGSAVCLESKPNKSSRAFSKPECVLECKRHNTKPEYCVGANYQARENLCDVFYSDANITYDSNFTFGKISGCQYLHRGTLDNLLCTSIFRARPGNPSTATFISGSSEVCAIAHLNDQFFVTRYGIPQVSVYNATSFQLLRQITFTGLGGLLQGLAASAINNYLYISDYDNNKVHRVDLSVTSTTTEATLCSIWKPHALSVTKAGNVIVTDDNAFIFEFAANGSIVQQITTSTVNYHAEELSNDVFVVSSHAANLMFTMFRNGTVIKSFGPATVGSGLALSMTNPLTMAVDTQGYILFADYLNNRVLVVNPTLTAARVLPLPANTALIHPVALSLDNSRTRLYIGESGGQNRVLIFDDVTNLYALFDT